MDRITRRSRRTSHRCITASVLFSMLALAACGPSAAPAVFAPASCPAGQHVKMAPVGPYGPPGCVR